VNFNQNCQSGNTEKAERAVDESTYRIGER